MNWPLAIALAAAIIIAALLRLRVEPRRARLVNWLFIYPGAVLLLYYAWFRGLWLEVLASLLAAGVVIAVWWISYGSYLPPTSSDTISVWGQEAKKPAQVAAEAQAEVERLKQEKEALQRELDKLKGDKESSPGEGTAP